MQESLNNGVCKLCFFKKDFCKSIKKSKDSHLFPLDYFDLALKTTPVTTRDNTSITRDNTSKTRDSTRQHDPTRVQRKLR